MPAKFINRFHLRFFIYFLQEVKESGGTDEFSDADCRFFFHTVSERANAVSVRGYADRCGGSHGFRHSSGNDNENAFRRAGTHADTDPEADAYIDTDAS